MMKYLLPTVLVFLSVYVAAEGDDLPLYDIEVRQADARVTVLMPCDQIDTVTCVALDEEKCPPCGCGIIKRSYRCPSGTVIFCYRPCLCIPCIDGCPYGVTTLPRIVVATKCSRACGVGIHNVTYDGIAESCVEFCCCRPCDACSVTSAYAQVPPGNICEDYKVPDMQKPDICIEA